LKKSFNSNFVKKKKKRTPERNLIIEKIRVGDPTNQNAVLKLIDGLNQPIRRRVLPEHF